MWRNDLHAFFRNKRGGACYKGTLFMKNSDLEAKCVPRADCFSGARFFTLQDFGRSCGSFCLYLLVRSKLPWLEKIS